MSAHVCHWQSKFCSVALTADIVALKSLCLLLAMVNTGMGEIM